MTCAFLANLGNADSVFASSEVYILVFMDIDLMNFYCTCYLEETFSACQTFTPNFLNTLDDFQVP
jgi:hypothetical protein